MSPLGSLLLSLSTLVLIARCGDNDPLPCELPPPFGPSERVARRDDLLVELDRCGLEEAPLVVDMFTGRSEMKSSCPGGGDWGGSCVVCPGRLVGVRKKKRANG